VNKRNRTDIERCLFLLDKVCEKAYNRFVEFPEKENANHGNIKEIFIWLL